MKSKKLLLIAAFLAIVIYSCESHPALGSADYYWYQGNKIYLERGHQEYIIYDDSLLNESDKEKFTYTESVSPLYPGNPNLKWGITQPNAVIEDVEHVFYRMPSYKGSEDDNVFITHRFYVKLKQTEDSILLQNLTEQYRIDIERDKYSPLWYIMRCGLSSMFNALELANIFYETELFAASEPEFIGGIYPDNDVTAIDQVTNDQSKSTKKMFCNGVFILESGEKIYNIQGMEIK
jgi:hypothetical protein